MTELESLREEIKDLVRAMRDLLLAGTSTQERIAIHHAKEVLKKYENIR